MMSAFSSAKRSHRLAVSIESSVLKVILIPEEEIRLFLVSFKEQIIVDSTFFRPSVEAIQINQNQTNTEI